MAERTLANHWLLLTSAFLDSEDGRRARERVGAPLREALSLLRLGLAEDLGCAPQGLDSEHVNQLMSVLLPGRMVGNEAYTVALPDVLEELLLFTAREEGLSTGYEWSRAVDAARGDYERALADPARPRATSRPRYEPETRPGAKLGRNDPCPCGSGRKYKKCCAAP